MLGPARKKRDGGHGQGKVQESPPRGLLECKHARPSGRPIKNASHVGESGGAGRRRLLQVERLEGLRATQIDYNSCRRGGKKKSAMPRGKRMAGQNRHPISYHPVICKSSSNFKNRSPICLETRSGRTITVELQTAEGET